MGRRRKMRKNRRHHSVARNSKPTGETGSCEIPELVDDRRHSPSSNGSDEQTSHGKEEELGLNRPAKVEPGLYLPNGDENGGNLNDLTNSVGAIELGASRTSDVDLDSKPEVEEEDRLEGAVGGSLDDDLESKGKQSIDEEKTLVLYDNSNNEDTGDEDEDESPRVEEYKTCVYCGKKKPHMQKCGACRLVRYCDKTCQKADWKNGHKKRCDRYKRFMAEIDGFIIIEFRLKYGPLQIRYSVKNIRDPMEALLESLILFPRRPKRFVLFEIVAKSPHPFRPGCFIQDAHGNRTHVVFYTAPMRVKIPIFPFPLPLEYFLTPGHFIWLIDPVWHHFLDGTVGIRIDHPDQFEIPCLLTVSKPLHNIDNY